MSDADAAGRKETLRDFDEAVNMAAGELEKWLKTQDSRSVGQSDGSSESVGHASGRRLRRRHGAPLADLRSGGPPRRRTRHRLPHAGPQTAQYDQTEDFIRTLLKQADPNVQLPPKTGQKDAELTEGRTPETYLSNLRIRGYIGDPLVDDKAFVYRMPSNFPLNTLTLGGTWTAGYEYFTAGPDARLAFAYKARNVNVVLSGNGPVEILLNGKVTRTLQVNGAPTVYPLVKDDRAHEATVESGPPPESRRTPSPSDEASRTPGMKARGAATYLSCRIMILSLSERARVTPSSTTASPTWMSPSSRRGRSGARASMRGASPARCSR